jgi:SEC-C motif-containing protein
MELCPCQSQKPYSKCCGVFHAGKNYPDQVEDLMRSRYSAFSKGEIDYILASHHPATRSQVNPQEIQDWSKKSKWKGLEIKHSHQDAYQGEVEFIASYETEGQDYRHHEIATFKKHEDKWYFFDGRLVGQTFRRDNPKVGRNDVCPCGSGKKYKKCCGV